MTSISLSEISHQQMNTKEQYIGDLVIVTSLPAKAYPDIIISEADRIDSTGYLGGFCPEDAPDNETIFTRVKVAGQGGSKRSIKKVLDDAHFLTYSVAEPIPDGSEKKTDYDHRGHAELEKATGIATATGANGGKPQYAQKIVDAYNAHKGQCGADEWSDIYHKVLKDKMAYTVRNHGGVYFVPVGRNGELSQDLRDLQQLFRAFGGSLMVLPQESKTADQWANPVGHGISRQINELKQKVSEFSSKTRLSNMEDKLRALSLLKKESTWVCGLLRTSAETYEQQIEDISSDVRKSMEEFFSN